MTEPGQPNPANFGSPAPGNPVRQLRRSRTDRMVTGVAGGLGNYFGVDAVIFRVLFAVLSFFGGVGLLLYLLCWLLIPEPEAQTSALDRAVHQLRVRRIPAWLVIVAGALVLWAGWFSWWAPRPTFPALALVAIVAILLLHRQNRRPFGSVEMQPTAPPITDPNDTESGTQSTEAVPGTLWGGHQPTAEVPVEPATQSLPQPTERLAPPLNDFRANMKSWYSEAAEAHKLRVRRRRPVKVAVALGLFGIWGVIALVNVVHRVPFPAYIWSGFAVLVGGLVISLILRRSTYVLLLPIVFLSALALAFGGTPASLKDGSGKIGWTPLSAAQLTDERQFAGQSTLDLTRLGTVSQAQDVTITQAAGEVRLILPRTLNATIVSDVHIGDIQVGRSHDGDKFSGGWNVHLETPPGTDGNPATTFTGAPITVHVRLATGHVQIDYR